MSIEDRMATGTMAILLMWLVATVALLIVSMS